MSGSRVLVVCVLVVLAGCGGLPFGGSDGGTATLADGAESTPATAETNTTVTPNTTATAGTNTTGANQTTPAGETVDESGETGGRESGDRTARAAIVGSGANATVTGGAISTERLVRAHRAYFERAESATRVEWGTLGLRVGNVSGAVNATGGTTAGVSVARTNDSTERLRTQSLLGTEIERFLGDESAFVGNATRVAVRGDRSAAARRLRTAQLSNDSAPGSYRNASGAVFDKTSAADGYDYSYAPADSQLANLTAGNVTGMFLPTLSATNLTYRGGGSVAGFEGYVYDGNGTAAVDTDELVFAGNVTSFDATVVVAPAGYVRYANFTFGIETGVASATQSVERALVGVDDTRVSPPAWLDRARANPERGLLDTGDTGEFRRTDEPSATLDGGRARLNVTLPEPTFDPRVGITETVRFQTERLERIRVGPVARYDYPTDAQRVEIGLKYTDEQVSRVASNRTAGETNSTTTGTNSTAIETNSTVIQSRLTATEANRTAVESNLTAAVWSREQQRFVPVDARIETETNTVQVTLTGDEVLRYQDRVIVVLDYERYRAFLDEAF